MQYLRIQCDIDLQFDTIVDNMEKRGMIWELRMLAMARSFRDILRGPPSYPTLPPYVLDTCAE